MSLQTKEEQAKHELLMVYRRGWKNGACFNAADSRFSEHPREAFRMAYARGYQAGKDASTLAGAAEADRLGYDARMSILRSVVQP